MTILLGARTFCKLFAKGRFFLYILVLRLVCLKMFISSQRNLPQLQYCASKLRNFTDLKNFVSIAYFVISLQIFTKFFFPKKLFLVIIVFIHYTLRKQCDFVLLRFVLTIINCQNRGVFNHFFMDFCNG